MAEQKEFNKSDRADRLEKIITGGLLLLTLLYGGWIYQVFGHRIWILIQSDRMGEAGDFIAGFTTPVVFLWLIYGYFLQRRELGLQRQELRQTRETFGKQVEMTARQAEVTEREAEAARLQSMPNLSLRAAGRKSGPHGQIRRFDLLNFGSTAIDLEITLSDASEREVGKRNLSLLEPGEPHRIATPWLKSFGPEGYLFHCTVSFLSERQDRFNKGWTIKIPDETSDAEIHGDSLTMFTMPGQSPPAV